MTRPASRRERGWWRGIDFPWTLAVAVSSVCATIAAAHGADWLVADQARLDGGAWWRALTGPLVHATPGHLARDVALCVLVGAGFERAMRRTWPWLVAFGVIVPPLVAFALEPEVVAYYGTSGLSHAMIGAVVTREIAAARRGAGATAIISIGASVVAAGLLGKLGYELWTGRALFPMALGPGVEQGPIAHLAGALVGVAVAACAWWATGSASTRARACSTSGAPRACSSAEWRSSRPAPARGAAPR